MWIIIFELISFYVVFLFIFGFIFKTFGFRKGLYLNAFPMMIFIFTNMLIW
jgi:hypothetical protein